MCCLLQVKQCPNTQGIYMHHISKLDICSLNEIKCATLYTLQIKTCQSSLGNSLEMKAYQIYEMLKMMHVKFR